MTECARSDRMKAAFVSTYDARDPTLWAGSTFHMNRALERQGIELQYIGPLREKRALYFRALQFAYQKCFGLALHRDREPAVLDGYAIQIGAALEGAEVDLVFCSGSVAIAHLETSRPIVFWTDATYDAIIREYIWEPPACKRSLRLGHAMEIEALRRCALAIYTSEWAARSAVEDYGADPGKVKVVPFGANIEVARSRADVERMIDSRQRDCCRLLFIGVGWERKGADIAIEVARAVNRRGLPCELTMLGQSPPSGTLLPAFVKHLGFLDKRTEAGRRRFDDLFSSYHYLILPARAEAFGVVLCEACSFGVPCLASRVGGIPTIVRDEVNGKLFPRQSDPDEYARYVAGHFEDFASYRRLARSAFGEYESRLNWDVAGQTVRRLLDQIVGRPG